MTNKKENLHSLDGLNVMVDLINNPAKQTAVKRLSQSVSDVANLHHVSLSFYLLASCYLHVGYERFIELVRLQLE